MTRSSAGSMRELGKGRWEIRVSLGLDEDGKRRSISRVVRGSKARASHALAVLVATRTGAAPVGVTLADTVQARIDLITDGRSPTTIAEYQRLLDVRIKPDTVGSIAVDKLTGRHLDDYYSRLTAEGTKPSTLKPIHRLLVSSLNQAMKWQWIDRNPAMMASPPSVPKYTRSMPKAEVVTAALVELLDSQPDMGSLVWVAALTAMRRGECCGLRWNSVDIEGRRVIVHRSIARVGTTLHDKDTKTHSRRVIDIDASTAAVLAARWDRAQQWAEEARVVLDPTTAHVWSDDPTGIEPWDPDTVTHAWRRHADRQNLSGVRLHDLRHLNASTLLDLGVPVAVVSERLGHASPAVTLGIYSHALPGSGRAAADLVEAALGTGTTEQAE